MTAPFPATDPAPSTAPSTASSSSPTSGQKALATEHVHEWQPNGNVEVDRSSLSPCSSWDDQLWTDVVALAVCGCGAVQRTVVGRKNLRRRGDALTRGARRA